MLMRPMGDKKEIGLCKKPDSMTKKIGEIVALLNLIREGSSVTNAISDPDSGPVLCPIPTLKQWL